MLYGILLAVFKLQNSTYCLVQGFQQLQSFGGTPFVNEYDCPRLDLTTTIFITPGKNIKRAVSIAHECVALSRQRQCKTLNVKKLCSQNLYLNMAHLIVLTLLCALKFHTMYQFHTLCGMHRCNSYE